MKKLWYFFGDNELLTTDEQKIKEKQDKISLKFCVWFSIIIIVLNILIIIFN